MVVYLVTISYAAVADDRVPFYIFLHIIANFLKYALNILIRKKFESTRKNKKQSQPDSNSVCMYILALQRTRKRRKEIKND